MYTCARCGEDSIQTLLDEEDESSTDQPEGWCEVCDDYRPIAE